MNSVLERWLRLPLRGQIAMATACFVLATLVLWLLLVRPQRLAQQELRVDIARLEQSYQQQLAQLSALPAEALLRAQLTDIADHSDAPVPCRLKRCWRRAAASWRRGSLSRSRAA